MANERGFQVEGVWRTKNATSWLWTLLRWLKWDLYANMERNIGKISALYTLIAPFYYLFSRGDWITGVFKKTYQAADTVLAEIVMLYGCFGNAVV